MGGRSDGVFPSNEAEMAFSKEKDLWKYGRIFLILRPHTQCNGGNNTQSQNSLLKAIGKAISFESNQAFTDRHSYISEFQNHRRWQVVVIPTFIRCIRHPGVES